MAVLLPRPSLHLYRVIISIIETIFVPDNQAAGFMPNSAANPLPTAQNSAAGGLTKIVINLLKYKKSSVSIRGNSDAERGFSPARREKRSR
jgi:hypothetical protein